MGTEINVLEKLIELSQYVEGNDVYQLIDEYCILEKVCLKSEDILKRMELYYKPQGEE